MKETAAHVSDNYLMENKEMSISQRVLGRSHLTTFRTHRIQRW